MENNDHPWKDLRFVMSGIKRRLLCYPENDTKNANKEGITLLFGQGYLDALYLDFI